MNQQNVTSLTLFDLLARSWQCAAAIERLRFSSDGSGVAFACADGTVSLAQTDDPEPPQARIRISGDLGQTTIRPREKQAHPLMVSAPVHESAPPLAALQGSDFLVGASSGAVLHLGADGAVTDTGMTIGSPIIAIDHALEGDLTAMTNGAEVFLSRGTGDSLSVAPGSGDTEVVDVAFSPSGRHLAVAGDGGVSVWSLEDAEPVWLCEFEIPGRPVTLSWSDDGQWLACALQRGGFLLAELAGCSSGIVSEFPTLTRSVSWSVPAGALVASGAFRIAAWSTETPPLGSSTNGALVSGRAGLVVVESVAAHPQRPLAAAGYANGQIVVAQIGGRDELLVKPSGGAVTALDWSPDGRHLAAGAADGAASIITFPPQIFK